MEQAAVPNPRLFAAASRQRQRATLVALLVAFVILSAWLGRQLLRATDEVAAKHRLERESLLFMDRMEGLFAAVKEAESALRGEILTSERVFRDDYTRALPRARELVEELRGDSRIHGDEGADLRNYLVRIESRLSALENVDRELAASGVEAAADLLRSQVRSESFGAIRQIKESIETRVQVLLEDVEAADQHVLSILHLALAGVALNLMLVLALAALVVRQNRQRRESQLALLGLNQRLEHQLASSRRLGDGLARLGKLGQLLQSGERVEEATEAIQLSLPRMLADIAGALYLFDPRRDHLETRAAWGERMLESSEVMGSQDCWALRQGRRHDSGAEFESPRCAHLRGDSNAHAACIPLVAHGRTLGILHLQAHGTALAHHATLLDPITEQIALALSNLELREDLRSQSIRDPLTGLFNRRYLESSFERELALARRRNVSLALVAFDLDHFKRLNDSLGHAAGDAVLEAFGDLLFQRARKEDMPCRLGGEEFVLVMPETALEQARQRGDSIRGALEGQAIEHLGRPVGPVTLSAGVAAFPEHGASLERILRAADAALYAAKQAGRNRVELAKAVGETVPSGPSNSTGRETTPR